MNLVCFLSIGCQIYSGWQADVMCCHFLHMCMWSQTLFSPSPSTHPGDLPRILDLVRLTCRSYCQGQYLPFRTESPLVSCCLCFLFALRWPGVLRGGPGTFPCQGLVDVRRERLAVLEFPRSQTSVLGSECVRYLGSCGGAPLGFGVPTP